MPVFIRLSTHYIVPWFAGADICQFLSTQHLGHDLLATCSLASALFITSSCFELHRCWLLDAGFGCPCTNYLLSKGKLSRLKSGKESWCLVPLLIFSSLRSDPIFSLVQLRQAIVESLQGSPCHWRCQCSVNPHTDSNLLQLYGLESLTWCSILVHF